MAKQFATIPIVDMKVLTAAVGNGREILAAQLNAALQECGNCYVINHGIPLPIVKRLQTECIKYFHLPTEEKQKHHPDMVPQVKHAYTGLHREGFHNIHRADVDGDGNGGCARQTLILYTWPDGTRNEELWPEYIKYISVTYRTKDLLTFSSTVHELSELMQMLLAESLGIPPTSFGDAINNSYLQVIALHYYPPLQAQTGTPGSPTTPQGEKLGLAPHLDTTLLSMLLCSEVAGLQVVENGEWIDVQALEGALVIQAGVLMQVMSNDKIKAKLHRAMTPVVPRFALVSTTQFPSSMIVEPLPHLVGDGAPANYTPFVIGDYLTRRTKLGGAKHDGDTLETFRIDHSTELIFN
ncbi:unnamed protein product [Calypogeia fissa]